MATDPKRDRIFTTLAVLMGLMAVMNSSKGVGQTFHLDSSTTFVFLGQPFTTGFVFLGQRLHGPANALVAPLFGVLLAVYAYGVWTMRRWVLPIAGFYAAYVILNLALFTIREPAEKLPPLMFMLGYAFVAIGVSSGGAAYLLRNRHRLG
jgi:hypothetical protein